MLETPEQIQLNLELKSHLGISLTVALYSWAHTRGVRIEINLRQKSFEQSSFMHGTVWVENLIADETVH